MLLQTPEAERLTERPRTPARRRFTEHVVTTHVAPSGTIELAIRAAVFPGHPEIYSKKDIEKEKELANIDFYTGKTDDGLDIVLIPKTYSTSPGLNVHAVKLPAGMSRLAYAAAHAAKNRSPGDKVIGKYKQTIPTHFTYSPSILGYYHLSRFLDCGHVEPAIVRTIDVEAHKPLADLERKKRPAQITDSSGRSFDRLTIPIMIVVSIQKTASSSSALCRLIPAAKKATRT